MDPSQQERVHLGPSLTGPSGPQTPGPGLVPGPEPVGPEGFRLGGGGGLDPADRRGRG